MYVPRYVYDLRIPQGVNPTPFQPKPLDGEVESFEVSLSSFPLQPDPQASVAAIIKPGDRQNACWSI
jgi:hypothetical protein